MLEFTIADRLRKAREHIGADQKAFAALTGISRGTIGNYESADYSTRKKYILAQWAMATGVSPEWIETGQGQATPTPPAPDDPDGRSARLQQLANRKRGSAHTGSATNRYADGWAA